MVGRFEERLRRYFGYARHDGTGLGDVVKGYLTGRPAEGVILAGRTWADLFSEYISAIERGAIVAPDIRFMHDEHRFATVDNVFGGGHPPDSFVAGPLASVASKRSRWVPLNYPYPLKAAAT
jgi:hypothetical protein